MAAKLSVKGLEASEDPNAEHLRGDDAIDVETALGELENDGPTGLVSGGFSRAPSPTVPPLETKGARGLGTAAGMAIGAPKAAPAPATGPAKPASRVTLTGGSGSVVASSERTAGSLWFDRLLAEGRSASIDQGIVNAYKGLLVAGEFHVVVGQSGDGKADCKFAVYTNLARMIYGDADSVRVEGQGNDRQPFPLTQGQCNSLVRISKYENALHGSLDAKAQTSALRKSGRLPLVEMVLAEYRKCTGQEVLLEIAAEQKRLELEQDQLGKAAAQAEADRKKFEQECLELEAQKEEFMARIQRLAAKERDQAGHVGALTESRQAVCKLLLTVKAAKTLETAQYIVGEALDKFKLPAGED